MTGTRTESVTYVAEGGGRGEVPAVIALTVVLALAARRLLPIIRRRLETGRAARLASERHAWRRLRAVIGRRDAGALYGALARWAERVRGTDPRRRADVNAALVLIGGARYGSRTTGGPEGWQTLSRAVAAARRDAHRRPDRSALPPLNPAQPSA